MAPGCGSGCWLWAALARSCRCLRVSSCFSKSFSMANWRRFLSRSTWGHDSMNPTFHYTYIRSSMSHQHLIVDTFACICIHNHWYQLNMYACICTKNHWQLRYVKIHLHAYAYNTMDRLMHVHAPYNTSEPRNRHIYWVWCNHGHNWVLGWRGDHQWAHRCRHPRGERRRWSGFTCKAGGVWVGYRYTCNANWNLVAHASTKGWKV